MRVPGRVLWITGLPAKRRWTIRPGGIAMDETTRFDTRARYIEGVASASRRTRFVVLVSIIASGLLFISSWNSRKSGWLNSRIETAQQMVQWEAWHTRDADELRDARIDIAQFEKARAFAKLRLIEDPQDAAHVLYELREMQVDGMWTVTIPIFGVQFDLNDLGFIGGFGAMVLMLWLRFSLFRELECVRTTFLHARRFARENEGLYQRGYIACLRESYELVAMRQVLTVPPLRGPDANAFWTILPRCLMVFPALSLSYVVLYDLLTLGFGTSVSVLTTLATEVCSATFMLVTWALALSCLHFHARIQDIWTVVAREIEYARGPLDHDLLENLDKP